MSARKLPCGFAFIWIAAVLEPEIETPAQISEYGNNDGYAIAPWEKQQRYAALMDRMRTHEYNEADRATPTGSGCARLSIRFTKGKKPSSAIVKMTQILS